MKKKSNWQYGLVLSLGVIGWVFVCLSSSNLLGWWYLPVLAVLIALILAAPLVKWWRKFTESDIFVLNFMLSVVFVGGILAAAFIGLNYIDLPRAVPQEHVCKVERFYRKEHHRSRRVGRHTIVDRQAYYTYHAEIVLPDSSRVSVPVTLQRYRRNRKNDSIKIEIHTGILGVDFVTP